MDQGKALPYWHSCSIPHILMADLAPRDKLAGLRLTLFFRPLTAGVEAGAEAKESALPQRCVTYTFGGSGVFEDSDVVFGGLDKTDGLDVLVLRCSTVLSCSS